MHDIEYTPPEVLCFEENEVLCFENKHVEW